MAIEKYLTFKNKLQMVSFVTLQISIELLHYYIHTARIIEGQSDPLFPYQQQTVCKLY